VISLVTVIIVLVIILVLNSFSTGKTIDGQSVETIPLSQEERQKVVQTVLSSDFIKDIPEKDPIGLFFFSFENNQRVWRDGFLIGKNKFLTQGTPTVSLTLNSKYISEFDGTNLCEIIQKANKNKDLGFESEYGKARLLIKYSSMLKHRDCLGF